MFATKLFLIPKTQTPSSDYYWGTKSMNAGEERLALHFFFCNHFAGDDDKKVGEEEL